MFVKCIAVYAEENCDVSFLDTKIFVIEENISDSNLTFTFGRGNVKVVGTCSDKRRLVYTKHSKAVEITAEHFSSGAVRQYVIKLCGSDLGMIKVERSSAKFDAHYGQPRLSLTDPYGRIIGEIANADNTADGFVVRDNTGHILAHGKKSAVYWSVDSGTIHPLLASALLFASRMERNACELVAANWEWVQGVVFGSIVAVGASVLILARSRQLI
jgi:hypothetical protein